MKNRCLQPDRILAVVQRHGEGWHYETTPYVTPDFFESLRRWRCCADGHRL